MRYRVVVVKAVRDTGIDTWTRGGLSEADAKSLASKIASSFAANTALTGRTHYVWAHRG